MVWNFWAVIFFYMLNKSFDGFGKSLLLTKAALIALLNLSIIHWSLGQTG